MKNPTTLLLTLLTLCGVAAANAQDLPKSQPPLILIVREQVKLGRGADHAKVESGWPAAFEKAKSPYYYLAMTSLTGRSEAWFVISYASHAAMAADMKLSAADTVLGAELARLGRADAELLDGADQIQAMARPELSAGAFPNLATQRFWEITTFHVRPGHRADFEATAKVYKTAAERAAPGTSYRVYDVMAGDREPTYIVFSSVASYEAFDSTMADGIKTMQGMTADERGTLQKFSAEGLISSETNRYRLDPKMSYVPKETRATDPAFWSPKKPAARP